jgi:hypothetical protein
MTEEELEAHLQRFLDAGAGMEELGEELARLGLYDPEVSEDSQSLFLPDEDVVDTAERTRSYWNIRDHAAKHGKDPQDVAEWMLRERKRLWKAMSRAQAIYDRNLRQLKAWLASQKAPWERFEKFSEFALVEYHQDFSEGESAVKLVGGEIVARKCAAKIKWEKDLAVLEAVKRLRALPADTSDEDLLAAAKALVVGSADGFKASALKADLKAKGLQFVNAAGKVVAYVYKVAADPAVSYKIVQPGVGAGAAEGEEEKDGE